ncbi:MAG: SO_0444 family Cu/Zn efflux transporter [Pelovirga sp.]
MTDLLFGILLQSWLILLESAPYVLFGFFAAGVLKAFVSEAAIARHLGDNSPLAVLKAALFGIPLPLCSCGVIPAAIALRKQGASRGAASAFIVSVPETGVDSISITWALLDPLMTLVRPLAAFFTALFTGLMINLLPDERVMTTAAAQPATAGDCGCAEPSAEIRHQLLPLHRRLGSAMSYAFGDLLGDIGRWLLLGILLAGTLTWLIPEDFFLRFADRELLSLLVMLGIGIPIYICASASTPIAAALVLKGLSPGAALVFLLAGPATNAATITVMTRYFGKSATAIYLACIAVCSLACGWLVNRIYAWSGLDISRWIGQTDTDAVTPLMLISALLLLLLIGRSSVFRSSGAAPGSNPKPGGT